MKVVEEWRFCEEWPTLNGRPIRSRPRKPLCRNPPAGVPDLAACPICGGRVVTNRTLRP